jgi:hypothetical protein
MKTTTQTKADKSARVHHARHAGGRPPKFDEPRRVVTVTLPERTLRELSAVENDLARAIVQVTTASISGKKKRRPLVELVEVAPGMSVILVAPSRCLKQIPWLRLVQIAPSRFLLTVLPGTPVEQIEIAILDLLDGLGAADAHERQLLMDLVRQVRAVRRDQTVWKAEILFVGAPRERFQS